MFALLKLFSTFIFAIFFAALIIALAFIFKVMNFFRKVTNSQQGGSRTSSGTSSGSYYKGQTKQQTTYGGQQSTSGGQQKQKIIPKDEGEYVDFEEVN